MAEETPPPVEETPPPVVEINQSYDVHVGDRVQLNGNLFNIASGQFDWRMTGPDGRDVDLHNPTMPGPSFVADQVGAYVAKLTTDDGEATVTVNAAEAESAPQAQAQAQGGSESEGSQAPIE